MYIYNTKNKQTMKSFKINTVIKVSDENLWQYNAKIVGATYPDKHDPECYLEVYPIETDMGVKMEAIYHETEKRWELLID